MTNTSPPPHQWRPTGLLIWWTNQSDCERILPLDIWPIYLYDQYQSRLGRPGRGRVWVHGDIVGAPDEVEWDDNKWTCQSASECAGIVFKAEHLYAVQYLPGFITTLNMELPAPPEVG